MQHSTLAPAGGGANPGPLALLTPPALPLGRRPALPLPTDSGFLSSSRRPRLGELGWWEREGVIILSLSGYSAGSTLRVERGPLSDSRLCFGRKFFSPPLEILYRGQKSHKGLKEEWAQKDPPLRTWSAQKCRLSNPQKPVDSVIP